MKIYVNGCSFTYGDELTDPARNSWPILLGNKLNANVFNDAESGGSNYRLVYQTIKNLKECYDLYILAWTNYARFTFYKSDNNFSINFNPLLTHSMYGEEKFYADWGKSLYKFWYNELFSFKLWLQQIIQLQSLLEIKNSQYLMLNTFENSLKSWSSDRHDFIDQVKPLINFEIMNDDQIFAEYEEIQYYISLIDTTKFYKWNDFCITDLKQSFPSGSGGHILEQGHEKLAELLHHHLCLKSNT